jgi:branched-chain amino acid transport system substrate-binding protein
VAVLNFADKDNLLVFSGGIMSSSLTGDKCTKHFFRVCGSTDQNSYALAYAITQKGHKKIAIVGPDYSFGHEGVAGFKKKLAEINPKAEIVVELYHPLGNKDFAPYISKVIAAKPDVIFTMNFGNDLTLFLKQGRPMGMNQKVFSYVNADDTMIAGIGDDDLILGNIGVETYYMTIPTKKNEEFMAKYYKEVGRYPVSFVAKTYLATMFWAEAVKKAGTTDVDAVIKAWEGLTYDSPAGLWTMQACDHQLQAPFWYAENVKENKFYKHAYVGPAKMIPAKEVTISCESTGCKMQK